MDILKKKNGSKYLVLDSTDENEVFGMGLKMKLKQ